jgi:hypothetical protein
MIQHYLIIIIAVLVGILVTLTIFAPGDDE